jgi:hypothetical protein
MNKLTDEELQSMLEAGEKLPIEDMSAAIYQLVFKE